MPRDAEAREWWAEVYEVRERIERRRAGESSAQPPAARRRGVREVRTTARTPQVAYGAYEQQQDAVQARRRPRLRPSERIGPRPDRIAAWAVALGVLLLVLAIISAHG